jgi:hypothetical protein
MEKGIKKPRGYEIMEFTSIAPARTAARSRQHIEFSTKIRRNLSNVPDIERLPKLNSGPAETSSNPPFPP